MLETLLSHLCSVPLSLVQVSFSINVICPRSSRLVSFSREKKKHQEEKNPAVSRLFLPYFTVQSDLQVMKSFACAAVRQNLRPGKTTVTLLTDGEYTRQRTYTEVKTNPRWLWMEDVSHS